MVTAQDLISRIKIKHQGLGLKATQEGIFVTAFNSFAYFEYQNLYSPNLFNCSGVTYQHPAKRLVDRIERKSSTIRRKTQGSISYIPLYYTHFRTFSTDSTAKVTTAISRPLERL